MTMLADEGGRPTPAAPPVPTPPVRALELVRLMDRAETEDTPTDAIVMIAGVVSAFKDPQAEGRLLRLLRATRDRHPADVQIHEQIGYGAGMLWWATGDPRAAEEGLGSLRTTIALRPDNGMGYYSLGTGLGELGDYDQAVLHLRTALALNPKFTFTRINLATALYCRGDPDGAEQILRETVRIDPSFGRANSDLAKVLWARGNFAAAAQSFLKAYECDPEYVPYVAYHAANLRKTGRFVDARAIGRKWLDQAKKDSPDRARVEDVLKKVERAAAAESKVALVLAGQDPSADNEERLLLAERCFCLRHEAAAARLYTAAFAADPVLMAFTYRMPNNDVFIAPRETPNRYIAAQAAARAGSRPPDGASRPSPAERTALQAQALAWLREELAVLRKQAASSAWPEKVAADFYLRLWLVEPAFAGLRPGPARADQPTAERAAWDEFWDGVRDTITLARRQPPPPEPVRRPKP
jgi:tetratricopeptide (TPR) repeat protein